jgi:hypothetical protein
VLSPSLLGLGVFHVRAVANSSDLSANNVASDTLERQARLQVNSEISRSAATLLFAANDMSRILFYKPGVYPTDHVPAQSPMVLPHGGSVNSTVSIHQSPIDGLPTVRERAMYTHPLYY